MEFGYTNPNDSEGITALVSCGCHIVLFVTGRGSLIGGPIAPLVKVTANATTYRRMQGDLDFDASGVIAGTESLDTAALRLKRAIVAVASGQLLLYPSMSGGFTTSTLRHHASAWTFLLTARGSDGVRRLPLLACTCDLLRRPTQSDGEGWCESYLRSPDLRSVSCVTIDPEQSNAFKRSWLRGHHECPGLGFSCRQRANNSGTQSLRENNWLDIQRSIQRVVSGSKAWITGLCGGLPAHYYGDKLPKIVPRAAILK